MRHVLKPLKYWVRKANGLRIACCLLNQLQFPEFPTVETACYSHYGLDYIANITQLQLSVPTLTE